MRQGKGDAVSAAVGAVVEPPRGVSKLADQVGTPYAKQGLGVERVSDAECEAELLAVSERCQDAMQRLLADPRRDEKCFASQVTDAMAIGTRDGETLAGYCASARRAACGFEGVAKGRIKEDEKRGAELGTAVAVETMPRVRELQVTIQEIMAEQDGGSVTLKELRTEAEDRLGLVAGSLHSSKRKAAIRVIVEDIVHAAPP